MESLTCKACGRHTVTRDLPPIGIDVVAVLEQLAPAENAPGVAQRGGRLADVCLRPRPGGSKSAHRCTFPRRRQAG